jgi:hypothetical protein
MPHVIVKLWPGNTQEQKTRLAEAIANEVMKILNYGENRFRWRSRKRSGSGYLNNFPRFMSGVRAARMEPAAVGGASSALRRRSVASLARNTRFLVQHIDHVQLLHEHVGNDGKRCCEQ